MMKQRTLAFMLGILIPSIHMVNAQVSLVGGGPYTLVTSATFDAPKGQEAHNSIGYGKNGIIQVNSTKGAEIISFQKFSTALALEKENSIDIKDRITGRLNLERVIALKTKSYIFLRDVKKDPDLEGITALEFFPDKLDLSPTPVPLFQSSRGVFKIDGEMYKIILSKDKSKFLCSYKLWPAEKSFTTKEIRGVYVFDENLKRLWGAECEMPYASKEMIISDLKLAGDGTAYLLLWVAGHYEVLVFQPDGKTVKQIEIKDANHLMVEAYLDENPVHEMTVISTYIEPATNNGPVRTAATGICIGKIKDDKYIAASPFYSIPADIVKLYADAKTLDNIVNDEAKGLKPAIEDLLIRDVYHTPNGSTKIIAEVNKLAPYNDLTKGYTTLSTTGGDVIIFSINANSKMEWIKKIRKSQFSPNKEGMGTSIKVICKENDLHLFFLDNIPNESDTPPQVTTTDTFLKGVSIDEKGNANRYSLGKIWMGQNRFYVRRFTDGGNNNLIENNRDNRKNKLFSIQLN